MKSPLLVLASCFALGILVAHRWPFGSIGTSMLLTALCLLGGLSFLRAGWARVSGAFVIAGFVIAGMASAGIFQNRFPADGVHNLANCGMDLSHDVNVEGVISNAPIRNGSVFTFDLNCRKIGNKDWKQSRSVNGKVRVRLYVPPNSANWAKFDQLRLSYGDAIRAPVRLERPSNYRNPGGFDFRWWLQSIEDIFWEGTIKSPMEVKKISESQEPEFWMLVAHVRGRLLHGIDVLYPPWSSEGRVGAVLKAILLGDRSSLDSTTVENFRQSGLYHLLVISGLHVGLLAAVVLFFLNFFRVADPWRALLLLLFLGAYNLLVEQRAPTLRASLMIGAYLLARFLYRDRNALNAVGLAGLALLVYRPAWLFEAGFELSFSAALLIVGLAVPILDRTASPYRRALSRVNDLDLDAILLPQLAQFRMELRALIGWSKKRFSVLERHPVLAEREVTVPVHACLWVVELIFFSAFLQVGLLMPMAATFHRVTLVGIGLNALAFPLVAVLLALALPTVLLGATVPAIAVIPGKLLFWVTNALLAVTEIPHYPSWLSYRIPGPPVWVAVGCAVSIVALAWSFGRNKRIFVISLAVSSLFSLIIATYPFSPRVPKGALEVTALDCGRGEALFIVLPDGATMLLNAGGREHFGPVGGRWNPGEEIVSPYLWSRGIQKIDVAVLGSGSTESIKAMEAVLRNFKVRELWRGPRVANPAYQDMIAAARERGASIREISQNNRERQGRATLQVLWPPFLWQRSRSPMSDDNPVLRITSNQGSFLWRGNTGDRVAWTLAESTDSMTSNVLESAKPLTGSPAQSAFLERVDPKVVVISGERNYGRAARSFPVYERLYAAGVRVLRTSINGAVTVRADGSQLVVQSYQKPQRFN